MNEQEFERATGHLPEQDDLERANCLHRGEPTHNGCGVCEHGIPVFQCHPCFGKSCAGLPIRYQK